MPMKLVGISHHTAPLGVRERFAHAAHEIGATLAAARAAGASEAVLLSTCNRTECYLADDGGDAAPAVAALMSARLGAEASPYLYVRRERDAVAHLFRVASGLDSLIIGEAQIQGQVRDAWAQARPYAGPVLNRLFQMALLVAGRVRSETAIGRGAASVSSASVQLAKQIFGSLHGRRAMVLGAGEMAELALESLAREGVRASIVANRTYERAQALAARHGAAAVHYDACWGSLHEIDLLICSTSAPHPVVTLAHVGAGVAARGDRPLCILDIAVPRDVEASVGELSNVYLYDLDALQGVAALALERRRGELPTAEALIAEEVARFWEWLAGLAAVPVLTEFRSRMDALRERELAQAMRRLGRLGPAEREAVEHFSRTLMNKFLHEPSVRLRTAAANGRGLGVVDTMRYLFALEDAAAADAQAPEPAGDEPAGDEPAAPPERER